MKTVTVKGWTMSKDYVSPGERLAQLESARKDYPWGLALIAVVLIALSLAVVLWLPRSPLISFTVGRSCGF